MLEATWDIMLELSPWLLLGAVVAAGLHVFLPRNFIQRELRTTQNLLLDTDWLLVRSEERSRGVEVPVPAEVLTNRDEIRAVCDVNCDLITAAADVPALEALIKAPVALQSEEDPSSDPVPNPDPHLSPYPEMSPSEYLTRDLLAPTPPATE